MARTIRTAPIGQREINFDIGHYAKQAHGSVMVKLGDTCVLTTVCGAKEPRAGIDFLPLTCDYLEKTFAAGRIPGGFYKREGRPRDHETLTSRIIDRSIRPLFPEGWACEVQVIATVFSFDPDAPSDVCALNGVSLALMLSDLPFAGPIAAVRVGRAEGKLIINPTVEQSAKSDLDIFVSCSETAITMVEGGADEVSEQVIVDALLFAHEACQPIIREQHRLQKEIGKPKRQAAPIPEDKEIEALVTSLASGPLKSAITTREKAARYLAIDQVKSSMLAAVKAKLGEEAYEAKEKLAKRYYSDLKYDMVRRMIVDEEIRIDGRRTFDIRPVSCEVGHLPRTHGSALFQRGETQAIVTTTLGTRQDEQRIESLEGDSFKRFLLHYNFPPYSVGETKFLRSPGRREIGHGKLAERAVERMIPKQDAFPYVLRVVSETTESNGSSSMATVCGATLSMMDAGVPIRSMVAGIAMGLIEENGKIAVLSDILGDEDHLGDMDFKVCGTDKGVTAVQMDIKLTGVSRQTLEKALEQARVGRIHILERMKTALAQPRPEISRWAPRITTLHIKPERIKDVIGPGGKVIKDIIAKTNVAIDVSDDGTINVASSNAEMVERALRLIRDITREPEVGKIYLGNVRKVTEFGAFVEIFPGTDGLLHISELAEKRVARVEDIVREGDEVIVKCLSIDRAGKIRLSRKEAIGMQPND